MLITHGRLITWGVPNQILDDHAIKIEAGRITDFGPSEELETKYPTDERFDACEQLVMPGSICAHTHFYSAFSRGMAVAGTPADFPEILGLLWWRLDRVLDEKAVYYSALVSLVDAVRHGTTTLIDHHASPNYIDGSLDAIARAVSETGVRAVLCYEVTDRDGPERASAGIRENLRFINRLAADRETHGHLGAMFGLHASLTLSEETLDLCRQAAPDGVGFHIHVAEHPVDEYDSLAKSGLRVVDRLEKHGLLGPRSIAVHAVHVDAKEMAILAQTETWVTHQPRSNMNNGVGLPRVEEMLRAGIRVCLGNDGFSNAMWEEWKTAYLAHKLVGNDPRRMNGMDVVKMAITNNASLASLLLDGGKKGVIERGACADLMVVDYAPFTPLTVDNLPWHILFGFRDGMVTSTMVDGRFLMKNRELTFLDEHQLAAEVRDYAPAIWARYHSNQG